MMDFFIVNRLTESGGLVETLSCAAMEGLRYLRLDLVVTKVFYELSLSLLLMTKEPNSKVGLSGVSMSCFDLL